MNTEVASPAFGRLLQLVSPSLPIGAYTYSQGIEWAVEAGWITSAEQLQEWLYGQLWQTQCYLEMPVFLRFYQSWVEQQRDAVKHWNQYLLANRETRELREEEKNRGRAFVAVIQSLHEVSDSDLDLIGKTQQAGFSYAAVQWSIPRLQAAYGLLWGWLENLVLAAVKAVPLGQNAGQKVLWNLAGEIDAVIERAASLTDDEMGASSMALAIASSQHESQYTRLFRS